MKQIKQVESGKCEEKNIQSGMGQMKGTLGFESKHRGAGMIVFLCQRKVELKSQFE